LTTTIKQVTAPQKVIEVNFTVAGVEKYLKFPAGDMKKIFLPSACVPFTRITNLLSFVKYIIYSVSKRHARILPSCTIVIYKL